MLRKYLNAALAAVVAVVLALAIAPAAAFADSSSRIVTLGADLTDAQRETVLSFFNLTEEDLEDMEVIEVNNTQEREYLEGVLDDSIIGYKTLSCAYIQITSSGGINVETANLTYVTKSTIYNALQTAGIENCNVVVTAPYEVSGTGALTGIFLAFEADGTELDEDKKEAATEELVATAELEETYGSEVAEVISDVKNEVTSSSEDLSSDEISELVEETASDYSISLSEDDLATIVSLIETIQQLDYDVNAFANTLSGLSESADGILGAIQSLFSGIVDFFKNLFASLTGGDSTSDSDSILDSLDTDVFELDGTEESEDVEDESDAAEDADAADDDATADDAEDADDAGDATAEVAVDSSEVTDEDATGTAVEVEEDGDDATSAQTSSSDGATEDSAE